MPYDGGMVVDVDIGTIMNAARDHNDARRAMHEHHHRAAREHRQRQTPPPAEPVTAEQTPDTVPGGDSEHRP